MKTRPRLLPLLLLAAFAVLAALPGRAAARDLDAATAAFREGNAAYERGGFAAAADAYRRATGLGASDARLEYNLGNALFREGKLGEAILHYERARKLAPTDPDILHNLDFARARTVDKALEPPADPVTRVLWSMHSAYSPRAGTWFALLLWIAGFLALGLSFFLPGAARLAARIAGAAAFALLLAFSPSLVYKIHRHENAARVVVLEPSTALRSGPGENYELLFEAHEGTTFLIVGRHGEWLSVKLPDGRGGYVRKRAVGEV